MNGRNTAPIPTAAETMRWVICVGAQAPSNLRGLRHDRLQQLRKSLGGGYVR
jgi:hypothetical protein